MTQTNPRSASPDMRRRILDQASALLAESGPDGLSMRKLSQRIGTSTIVLYTHFRDKPAILDELFVEGFERLHGDLLAVPDNLEPVARVMELGRAYRRSAVANATYYQLMFSRCVPGFDPSAQSRQASKAAFAVLRDAVARCVDAGLVAPGDPVEIAHTLWGTLHGLISLELFGYLPPSVSGQARLEQAIEVIAAGMRVAAPNTETPGIPT